MNSVIPQFWCCLEQLRGLCGVQAGWERYLEDRFPSFRDAFLLARPEPARFYPCPKACGCAHEVVVHGPNDIVGVCRCENDSCRTLALSAQQVVVWQLNWRRMGQALARALNLEPRFAQTGLPQTWQLGAWSADAVLAFLTVQHEADGFHSIVAALVAGLRKPFILFAPTAQHLELRAHQLLTSAGALFLSMEGCVGFSPHTGLHALKAPGELLAPLTPQPGEAMEESEARNAFALVRALDAGQPVRKAPLYTVFRLYCVEGLTVEQVAKRCRCARSLIFSRLNALRNKLGASPRQFRQYAGHFERLEESLTDARARHVRRDEAF